MHVLDCPHTTNVGFLAGLYLFSGARSLQAGRLKVMPLRGFFMDKRLTFGRQDACEPTKQETPRLRRFFVVPQGFEPWQAEPKSDVLPLHHGTMFGLRFKVYGLRFTV